MSYSISEAKLERQCDLSTSNPEKLYELAKRLKAEGEDELAEEVFQKAARIEHDNDWAYDEWIDNKLSKEI